MRSNQAYPGENKWKGWLYLLPGFLIYLGFTFYPILETVRTSFYEWNGFSARRDWIGLQNYRVMFYDAQFTNAFLHNLIFILFFCVLPVLLGLLLASLLTRKTLPGMTFFRTVLFLPQVISMVVVGVIWRWIFNPQFGPLNILLKAVGLGSLTRAWLGDFALALPAVGSVGTWVQYGFCMILFLAGMQHISEEYYEASSLDGANAFQQFLHITIPGLRAEIGVALVTTIIAALRVFDLVYVTTRGGPGNATLVVGFLIYRSAFQQNRIGYASAVATVLMIIILAISLLIRRLQNGNEEAKE
ncbi:MAG: sugar ABC transporter permease [Chloroflexi bacterium]|jgi:raffinose/stachyose/melibiose transport system permease protein|nr:sugar ABC transporter permease [Anaerolineaceae bacterium]NLI43801.1 sugar ABC transporter permease [Chloroflexota bacterium]HOE35344.1 sugar ABC transporter permease [Anaerolineaceae bacterium]HOT25915.1 sugar ABC transporter permease [Anaerolineaceae bacterium]HQH58367.1 sugar ABC transporter permease [Anaerolineaceae bacterium]